MLKEFLVKNKISSKDLAARLEVSPSYISAVLTGKKKLSEKYSEKLKNLSTIQIHTTYVVITNSITDKIFALLASKEGEFDNSLLEDLVNYFHV